MTSWAGRSVLVTGHSGFKGAWLASWLDRLGATVHGLSLPPDDDRAAYHRLAERWGVTSTFADLRDRAAVGDVLARTAPDVVFHLAAQALVRASYDAPVDTFATNVMGTLHVLEAARALDRPPAVVVATTDKVYRQAGDDRAFTEDDELGAADPYSTSKACVELAVQSWRRTAPGTRVVTVRAGNVIGGGDRAPDRLVPDLVRALEGGEVATIRNPSARRPWQFVLEPLQGYLAVAGRLLEERPVPDALNFGPTAEQALTVEEVVAAFTGHLGGPAWRVDTGEHPHEAPALRLDAGLAARTLGWRSRLTVQDAIAWTAEWYAAERAGGDLLRLAADQIERYEELV